MGISLLKDANAKHAVSKEFTASGDIAATATSPLNVRAENQLRVVVENVGGGNTVLVKGKIAKQTSFATLATITGPSSGTTIDISLVDEIYYTCGTYSASGGTPKLVASGFFEKASSGGGGGGSINSASNVGSGGVGLFDAAVGSDLQFNNINVGPSGILSVTLDGANKEVDIEIDPTLIDVGVLTGVGTLNTNTWLGVNGGGDVESIADFGFTTPGGIYGGITYQPNNAGGQTFHLLQGSIDPLQNSPNDSYQTLFLGLTVDPSSTGFDLGTSGGAGTILSLQVSHQGTSDTGGFTMLNHYLNIGNGTDAISVKGLSFSLGFASVNANVTMDGSIQGYVFQPFIDPAASMPIATSSISPFSDNLNADLAINGYNSFNSGPQIGSIRNNNGWAGFNVGAQIDTLVGNASIVCFSGNPQIGAINSGYCAGVNINPTVTLNKGTFVGYTNSVSNVTNYAGVKATLVEQDLTFECIQVGTIGNSITIEYTPGGTAGSEVVTAAYPTISVQIDSGVSTATQIKAAIEADLDAMGMLGAITVSGVGSDPQVTFGPLNLAGGEDAGAARAADFNGDVTINGGLQFSGGLNIGALNAYFGEALVDGGGQPGSGHSLITAPAVAANVTVANADYLGVNTAALINIGANATVTTAFLGVAALGLPAVLTMGAGATLDMVAGAVFALSMDAGAGGGTVDTVALCRALALPNGITTVNRLYGYEVSLPFGTVATDQWGIYSTPVANNWLNGSLKIGGTAITDDKASPGIALEVTGDSILDGECTIMDKVGFYGTTPVAQQASSGAVSAGGTYTSTEQTMIQEMYDALRAYGLLT
jgi:hypothetical protein